MFTDASAVQLVAVGTTSFVNAVIPRKGLAPVAVLRLCGPATRALPPFCDVPPDLAAALGERHYLLPGSCTRMVTPCQTVLNIWVQYAV